MSKEQSDYPTCAFSEKKNFFNHTLEVQDEI